MSCRLADGRQRLPAVDTRTPSQLLASARPPTSTHRPRVATATLSEDMRCGCAELHGMLGSRASRLTFSAVAATPKAPRNSEVAETWEYLTG